MLEIDPPVREEPVGTVFGAYRAGKPVQYRFRLPFPEPVHDPNDLPPG